MGLEKVKSVLLIVCVVFSLFVSAWFVPYAGGPGVSRPVQVYIVEATDGSNSWVGNTSAVKEGVEAAMYDAGNRTKVVLNGETINYEVVSNTSRLEELVENPPERAVFVNAHGEPVPMPNDYFSPYIRIDSPANGAVFNSTSDLVVEACVAPMPGAQLAGLPHYSVVPAGCVPTSYGLLQPEGSGSSEYRSGNIGGLYTGDYEVQVWAQTTRGLSACAYVYFHFNGRPCPNDRAGVYKPHIPWCPYVHVWNGLSFDVDNNLFLEAGNPSMDHYVLERRLVEDADGDYRLRLSESANKHDFLDRVQLLSVDHAQGVNVGVGSDGAILAYGCASPPTDAQDSRPRCVLWWLMAENDDGCLLGGGEWVDVKFDGVNASSDMKLVLRVCSESQSLVNVQRFNGSGVWETVACVRSRTCWSTYVLNASGWLPDSVGECKLRLLLDGECSVDFVGLATAAEADVVVSEGELVGVEDSSGTKATFGDLLEGDGVCARLEHGYAFDLRFRLPELNGSDMERDFIFVVEGYYSEESGGGMLAGLGNPLSSNIWGNWKDWFEKIEDCCRTAGWVWANVAGYSFFYAGNSLYWSLLGPGYDPTNDWRQPKTDGLKQFMNKDVNCTSADWHVAEIGPIDQDRPGFYRVYQLDRFGDVDGWRPLNHSDGLLRDATLYVDKAPSKERVTVALVMNGSDPGMFVHSGLGRTEDDFTKGYIATALAIEEARVYIVKPESRNGECEGNPHLATFSVSMVAGSEGWTNFNNTYYEFVDLLFSMNSYYEKKWGWYWDPQARESVEYWYYSEIEDLELTRAGGSVMFDVDEEAGIDTITSQKQLADKIGWWATGQTATFFLLMASQTLHVPLPFAGLVGLFPMYLSTITPPASNTAFGEHNWVNDMQVDTNDDDLCTSVVKCRVYFPSSSSPVEYSFNCMITSWISYRTESSPIPNYHVQNLNYDGTLYFAVKA